jgi:aspartate/glutamate racemase
MKKIAYIYTSHVLVEMVIRKTNAFLPSVEICNIVNDNLLKLVSDRANDERIKQQLLTCYNLAVMTGADIIVNTCTSVSRFVDSLRSDISIPIVNIDEPLIKQIMNVKTIGIVATIQTAAQRICDIVQLHSQAQIHVELCEKAFQALEEGREEAHNFMVTKQIDEMIGKYDMVLLAQASIEIALKKKQTSVYGLIENLLNYLQNMNILGEDIC